MQIISRPNVLPPSLPRWRRMRDRIVGAWYGSEIVPIVVLGAAVWIVFSALIALLVYVGVHSHV